MRDASANEYYRPGAACGGRLKRDAQRRRSAGAAGDPLQRRVRPNAVSESTNLGTARFPNVLIPFSEVTIDFDRCFEVGLFASDERDALFQ